METKNMKDKCECKLCVAKILNLPFKGTNCTKKLLKADNKTVLEKSHAVTDTSFCVEIIPVFRDDLTLLILQEEKFISLMDHRMLSFMAFE